MGLTGQQIYDNFANARGTERLSQAARMVEEVKVEYAERAQAVRDLTNAMEAVWQGDSAGAARRGAGPLAVEHELAGQDLGTVKDLTSRQVDSFNNAKNSVQPIPQQPQEPGIWDNVTSFGGASDTYENQVREFNAANDHNVSVMQGYSDASAHNTGGMPSAYGTLATDMAGISSVEPAPTDRGGDDSPVRGRTTGSPGFTGGDGGGPGGGHQPPPGGGQPGGGGGGSLPPGGVAPTPGTGTSPSGLGQGNQGAPGLGGGYHQGGQAGQNPGQNQGFGQGFGAGFGPGFGPVGGGGGAGGVGAGGRGTPGGGVPGAGAHGEQGRPVGGRTGAGPVAGAAAADAAAGRGGAGGRGAGGAPMGGGGGGRGQGGEDEEHASPSFLQEHDPDSVFGTDEITAPPVIGA
ncbi:hypothetical protein [Actinokineospora iranica]|uniref:PPE family protein n=1 Tax=Actinokineospora iranica TaxID=1271860 RepID=A0A1G6UTY3_9PSEU|nr:hypothetical protein [Actinokineospora iranica]SDD44870.1 hypothetical protein SAMN05216174_11193 [Actinokineospora iranica]